MNDNEKITINLGPVDLGRIDVLVEQGLYSNRSDAIRTELQQLSALLFWGGVIWRRKEKTDRSIG